MLANCFERVNLWKVRIIAANEEDLLCSICPSDSDVFDCLESATEASCGLHNLDFDLDQQFFEISSLSGLENGKFVVAKRLECHYDRTPA